MINSVMMLLGKLLSSLINIYFFFLGLLTLLSIIIFKSSQLITIIFLVSIFLFLLSLKTSKRFFLGFKISLLSIFLMLILIEIVLHFGIFNFENNNNIKYEDNLDFSNKKFVNESDLGFSPNPGKYNQIVKINNEIICNAEINITEDRLRNTIFGNDKNSFDNVNINFFGGSYVFGHCLNDEDTIPSLLNTLDKKYNSVNYGFQGYGIHQALYILRNDKRSNSQDINILITAPWHNWRSLCLPDFTIGSPRYKFYKKLNLIKNEGKCRDTFDIFPNILKRLFWAVTYRSKFYSLAQNAMYNFNKNNFELYLEIIKEINRLSIKRNERFIVGFINSNVQELNYFEILNQLNIEHIDLTLADYEQNRDIALVIHNNDKHPSSKANYLKANLIHNYLNNLN